MKNPSTPKYLQFLLLPLFVFVLNVGWGQQSIITAGSAANQNFNGMSTSGTATLPEGFKIGTDWSSGTTVTTLAYGSTGTGAVTGSSGGGAINWANGITGSATDRALGFLSTGSYSSPRSIIYAFTNNTGSTVTSISLSWNYEKYRSGTRAFDWTFFHGSTSTASTANTSGDQTYAADANNTTISNPPILSAKSFTISSLNIANGATYYLRWTYTGSGGSTNSQGLGIDDFSINLTAAAAPTITGSATATAFTTTYGTASVAQSFTVSGSNLTANLVATAPTGFEVSSDGTTYGSTATFTQTSGSASGTLSIRLAAAALVGGTYNSRNIVLSSTGATSVNITTAASGNTVSAKALTITANNITKTEGATLTGGAGSTAFTSSGLVGGESIGSVTITYGTGASASDAAGTYVGQVTPSLATGGTFSASNYSITYVNGNIIVEAAPASPTITVSGTLSALSTTYGTPSSTTSFTVSGAAMTSGITIAPPTGFEVATTSDFSSTIGTTSSPLLIGSAGTIANTTIYVRIRAVASVADSPYSGNISLTSAEASNQSVATSSSTVNTKTVTITGVSGVSKIYDGTTTASLTGTAVYDGLANNEIISVTGTPSASFANKTVGTAKTVTITGYNAPSSNYTLTQPSATADITALSLTVTGAAVSSKTYDGTTSAIITGSTLVGVISPDVVTISTTGTFASANAGIGVAVTSTQTLGGADAGNYTLTLPTGLAADITKANQTITFGALATKATIDFPFTLSGTSSSGLIITFSSSNSSVATVSGNVVTIVGAGTTTITASQAGDGNYFPATMVSQVLTVKEAIVKWNFDALTSSTATPTPGTSSGQNPSSITGLNLVAEQGANSAGSFYTAFHNVSSTWSNLTGNGSTRCVSVDKWSVSDYFEFNFSSLGFSGLAVQFSQTKSATGPSDFKIQYIINGGTPTDVQSYTITNVSWSSSNYNTNSVYSFLLPISCSNTSSLKIRIVNLSSGVAATGTSRIDDFLVYGDPCVALSAPTVTNASRCGTGTVSISATPGSGETIDWYSAATGGTLLANGSNAFTTPSISSTTTYYAEARNTTTGCVSSTRTAVTATINPTPVVTNMTASICSGSSFSITPVNGTNGVVPNNTTYSWSAPTTANLQGLAGGTSQSAISGTVFNTTNAGINTTYTVTPTATAGSCVGATFTVAVTVNALPTSLELTGSPFCSNTTGTVSVSSSQSNVTYDLYASGDFIGNTSADGTGSGLSWTGLSSGIPYTVVATNDVTGCSSVSNAITLSSTAANFYRSATPNGNWTDLSTWTCSCESSSGFVAATTLPTDIVNTTILSGHSVTVTTSSTNVSPAITGNLTLEGTLKVEGKATVMQGFVNNGSLQIFSNAGFLQKSTTTTNSGTGTVSIKQNFTGSMGTTSPNGRYWYLGSPVTGSNTNIFLSAGNYNNRLWNYNESNNSWVSVVNSTNGSNSGTSETMTTNKGYLFRTGATNFEVTYSATATQLHNHITTPIQFSGQGYKYISNPYISHINWLGIARTGLNGAYWVKNPGNTAYLTYNATTNTGTVSSFIPPMQGFFVYVYATTGTLVMNNSHRTHAPQTLYAPLADHEVRLELTDGKSQDEVVVYEHELSSNGLEETDTDKMMVDNSHQLYLLEGSRQLTLDGLADATAKQKVDMGIQITAAGTYTINATELGIEEDVVLEDKFTHTFQDLKRNSTYSFTSNVGTYNNRFVLHFTLNPQTEIATESVAVTEEVAQAEAVSVYTTTGQQVKVWVTNTAEFQNATVKVYDAIGNMVERKNMTSNELYLDLDIASGIYVVEVTGAEKTFTKKVFISK